MKYLILLFSLFSCSNATMAQISAYGSNGYIKCYSGTLLIYEGKSNGKISEEQGSDGWYFQEKDTGKLIRVSGACVIEN